MKTTVSLPFAILLGLVSFSHGPACGQDQAVRPSGGQTSVPTAAILSHPKEDPFRHLRHAPRSDGQAAEVSPFACVTNNGTITITKYVATSRKVETRNGIVPLLADLADETATIPVALHGCPVVEIGANAFANCTRLTSIQIPEGVRLIGDSAFRWCPGLQTLQLPASVTSMHATAFADCPGLVAIRVDDANPVYWNDADGVVFSKDKKTLVRYPSGLTGDYKVPDTVAVVGDFAFVGCRELKTVELPVGVTSVGPWAFADCSALTSIAFPDSLAKISEFAFWGCGCLSGLSIPDSVTNIGYFTFAHCHGLTAATLPRSVTAMGPNVFRNCGRLTNIVVAAENPAFCSIDGVVFDKQKTRLIAYPCGRTGSYVVPDGVTYVDQSSFRGAGLVTSVALPRTVTGLGYKAFLSCGNVDGFFFSGDAPGLRRDALAGCGRATAYHRTQARRWGKDFGGRPTGAWDPAHPFAYTNINGQVTVTRYASPDETALVPDMIDGLPVAAIGPSAFQNCRHLTRVVLPATLTRIGVSAFRDCVSLADVAIPPGVATVERSAFQGCASLADVGLADGLRKIDASAFAGCAKLTEVRLPASVAIVGANAFADCPSLAAIRADDGNPAFRSDKDGVLFSKDKATLVCYPVGKAGKYAVPSCVTNIGPNAFESCTGLTSVAFSRRLVSIGGRAFARCRNLSGVTFSKGLVNIGAGAFQDCARLSSVALPERVASLGDFAFWNCPRLTRVSLPASVVRIGGTTFGRCGGLTAVDVADANTAYCSDNGVVFCKDKTVLVCFPSGRGGRYAVPDHVTQIGRSAFESCGKVADIVMPDRVERVGDFAFKNCGALTNAVLSARLAELGIEAFSGCAGLSRVSVPVSVSRIGDRAFQSCPNLAEVRFGGNAPRPGRTVFRSSPKAVVYRQPDAQGWGTEFAERPTAVWDLPAHSPAFSTSVTMADITLSNAVSRVTARPDLRRRSSKLNSSVILNSGDYFYKTNSARQAIITGFNSNYIGALSITNILGGCPVSSIWPWGFMNCTFLTAVSIPSGISYIAPQALTRCPALKTFMVDAGNATYSSLDGVLFNKERTELIKFPGNKTGHYTIPEGTTRIGYWAFKACNNISEVSIPSSVTNIGSEAFDECANLTAITAAKGHPLFSSVAGVLFDKTQTRLIAFPGGKAGHYAIPPSVTNIGSVSFAFCKNLTGVTIPDSVTDLDTMAFYSCVKLTSVTIPDHVTSIGRSAFGDCDNLTCVTVGKGVISIGPSAFSRSLNLRDVFFRGNAPRLGPDAFQYNNRVTVHYQAGTMGWGKEFGGRPTAVWGAATPVQPAAAKSAPATTPTARHLQVGALAPALAQGKYVQGEPVAAFERGKVYVVEFWATWCGPCRAVIPHVNKLQEKYKEKGLVVIGQNVFQRGENVEQDVADFVKQMGADMTYRVALDRDGAMAETWMKAAGKGGIPAAFVIDQKGKIAWIGHPLSGLDEKVEELLNGNPGGEARMPDRVAATPSDDKSGIPGKQFTHTVRNGKVTICKYTGSGGAVNIPGTIDGLPVTEIGYRSFAFNRSITHVAIPLGVTTIADWAFNGCSNLTNAVIPDSVVNIRSAAFGGSGLTRVVLPASVTNIECRAFESLENASEIVVDTDNPAYSSQGGVLFDKTRTTLIQWPNGKAANYTIPSGVTRIGKMAFFNCGQLTQVTFASSVDSIGASAFSQCSGLTSLAIPASVTNIGSGAFVNCLRMTAFTVDLLNPNYSSVEGILFNKNQDTLIHYPETKTGKYTIPPSVTTVDGFAFQYCKGLTEITIPDTVTCLRESALFATGLTHVTVPAGVTNIGHRAFGYNNNLKSIAIDPINPCYSSIDGVLYNKDQTMLIECPGGFTGNCTVPASVTRLGSQSFYSCGALTSVTFMGDAPSIDARDCAFHYSKPTVYYRPGTKGWGEMFDRLPTTVWNPQTTITP